MGCGKTKGSCQLFFLDAGLIGDDGFGADAVWTTGGIAAVPILVMILRRAGQEMNPSPGLVPSDRGLGDARSCGHCDGGGSGRGHEQALEGLPELPGHSAVDPEVDGVGEADEEVGEEDEDVDDVIVEHAQLQGGVEDVEHREDGQGDLDGQEAAHHDDQHQLQGQRLLIFVVCEDDGTNHRWGAENEQHNTSPNHHHVVSVIIVFFSSTKTLCRGGIRNSTGGK